MAKKIQGAASRLSTPVNHVSVRNVPLTFAGTNAAEAAQRSKPAKKAVKK
jgi:hypothetical protein